MKIENDKIIDAIAQMQYVPGRMEKCSDKPLIFVDYAHTDDALNNILSTLSELLKERELIVIFGCGGDRDHSKRPRMGKVAAKFADKIIITSDNPRSENEQLIINEIIAGIPQKASFQVFLNRKKAIQVGINDASKNSVIVIAGKGHEKYQEINGKKFLFDDREIVYKFTQH